MKRSGVWGKAGMGLAWAAAYALVLNIMLATSLLAAQPVGGLDPFSAICLSHATDTGDIADDNGASERAATHCKFCIPGLADALADPIAPSLFLRIAIAQPEHFAFQVRLKQFARTAQYSPRAPPVLI